MRHRLQPIVSERRSRFRLTLPTILLPFFVLVLLGRGERIRSPLDEREADLALAAQPANWSASATRARPASSWTPTATALASIAPLTLGSAERHLRLPGVFAGAAAAALGSWRVLDSTIYITLEPCAMCAGAIVLARIPRVVFGAWDPKAGAAGSVLDILSEPQLNHSPEVLGGVLEDECAALLTDFFAERR